MKLNYECIRSVLLELENRININDDLQRVYISVDELFTALPRYESKDILYTVEKLSEAGYINASVRYASGMYVEGTVSGITYRGHEFIETIRDSRAWTNTKKALSKLGTMTLPLIAQAAEGLAKNALDSILSSL